MRWTTVAERIGREVEARLGLPVTVALEDQSRHAAIVLGGAVSSAAARETAGRIAGALAPGRRIENDLEVEREVPAGPDLSRWGQFERLVRQTAATGAGDAFYNALDAELASEFEPYSDGDELSAICLDGNDADAAEGLDGVYFAPTDPVVTTDALGRLQVLGGFSATSMDSVEVEPSAHDAQPGDQALADAIRRELREDALTTDLRIRVAVRRGIAYLRGTVLDIDNVEDAEEVASRVPGVREVIERLAVSAI